MYLFLMRHGDAVPVGDEISDDMHRVLSPGGRREVRAVAEGMRRQGFEVEGVFSSPLARAKETASLMAAGYGVSEAQATPALAPNAPLMGVEALFRSESGRLKTTAETSGLLFVGHHPDVTFWLAFLTNLDASVCPLFGTASIAALEFKPPKKKASFSWFKNSNQWAP